MRLPASVDSGHTAIRVTESARTTTDTTGVSDVLPSGTAPATARNFVDCTRLVVGAVGEREDIGEADMHHDLPHPRQSALDGDHSADE
ncbi:hypothetical protein GCM10023094_17610 [Rhodococcus olei]|uniref:Uncharacterized protein n=1 Tax=Rhodococcus olei TaxID=2161675 RepID=A0ABP8P0J9_9NOCA